VSTRLLATCASLALLAAPLRAAELMPLGAIADADDPVLALTAPAALVASPDGRHVYAVSFGEDAVSVLARDAASGALAFVEAQRDGDAGAAGVVHLVGPNGAAASPDGTHLYVAATTDQAVVVFEIGADGRLSFARRVQQGGVGPLARLRDPRSVAVSPDGRHLYVTCDDAVLGFARAPDGTLSGPLAADLPGASGAEGIAIGADGRHVYVGGYALGQVVVYERDRPSGALALVDVLANGDGPIAGLLGVDELALSFDGRDLYANGTLDSSLVHFRRDPDTGALGFVAQHQDGAGGVDGLASSAGIALGTDGVRVFAGAGFDPAVAVFARDRDAGGLDFLGTVESPGTSFTGVGSQLLSVGGHLYAANGIDGRIRIFAAAPLHLLDVELDGVAGASGLAGAEGVAVSADARFVYATGADDDALGVFRVQDDGGLAAVATIRDGVAGIDGLDGAYGVVLMPDGRHVYAAGSSENAIAAFARDAGAGTLGYLGAARADATFPQLLVPRGLAASPDGRHLYAAATASDTVVWLARDAGTGAIAFAGFVEDGVAGVDGLDGASGVAVSQDGRHVYAASVLNDAVAVFARDAASGALAFVELEQDGVAGVDGLDGASALALAPDDRHVYVAGMRDGAVAVFARNAANGRLVFVEQQRDNTPGLERLAGPGGVAVSGDGALVVVAVDTEDALQVFRRDPVSGRLARAQTELDGVGGFDQLAGARGVAIAPRGRGVFVTSSGDAALLALAPEPGAPLRAGAALAALAALARARARR
jgi:6-phosphogluconolactonase (cycloisomerase 2 family)